MDISKRVPLTSTWPHLRCDVGLEEGEYRENCLCLAATTFWRSIGCPRSGVVNDNRLQWKYRYKLAIKQAEKNADQIFNEELFEYFNAKDDTAFWHAWRKKYCSSSLKTTGTLNGKQRNANVCNEYTEQFRSVFQTNTVKSYYVYEAEFFENGLC